MTKRRIQPPPKEATVKQDAELIVTFIGVDTASHHTVKDVPD